MLDELYMEMEEKTEKTFEAFKRDLSKVRTGRASAAILDGVRVNYYNVPTPLNQTATISVPEPRMILVNPYEKNMLGEISKAIAAADLGLNPNNDGQVIRIPIPQLTEDRRKEIARQIGKMAEEARVSVRNARRDSNDAAKKAEKNKDISEDDLKRALEEIQKLTDAAIKKIDEAAEVKEKEIMEV